MSELNAIRDSRQVFEDETVAAERDFAERVACDGIRTAFLSVLAEDAMILGDGPERGRPAYAALPQDYPGRLAWEPRVVAAALDGSLGALWGPRIRLDGTSGAFIIVLGAGEPEPITLAGINA